MRRTKNPRSKIFKIRLTQAEFDSFHHTASAADLPMSDLARSMIIGVKPHLERRRRFVFHKVDPALLRTVASIGNNLNQLAAFANTHKSGADTSAILIRLIAFERALSDLVEANSHNKPPS